MTYIGATKPKGHFLYAIAMDGATKFGISSAPEKRLREMQVGSPVVLKLAWALKAYGRQHVESVERRLHQMLAGAKLRGEWFSVSPCEARPLAEALIGNNGAGASLAQVKIMEIARARGEWCLTPPKRPEEPAPPLVFDAARFREIRYGRRRT